MAIKYIQGNIFTTECDLIAHGCNCRGGYGKGIAYQIAQRHPEARVAYMMKYNSPSSWKLGDIQYVSVKNSKYKMIVNVATQDFYHDNGTVHANYPAIQKVMEELALYCKTHNYTLAIPKIGAGLARGDWNIIEKIINDAFVDQEITVYVL